MSSPPLVSLEPTLKTLNSPLPTHGLSIHFNPDTEDNSNIKALWPNFLAQEGPSALNNPNPTYGIFSCNQKRYWGTREVSSQAPVPEGFSRVDIPAGKYAVFTHLGPISRIKDTIEYIYRQWLPKQTTMKRGDTDVEFEKYDQRFKMEEPDSQFEYWIPIQ